MIANYLKNDITIASFIIVGILIRYLPQIYYDIANRGKKVLLKAKTTTKAWHIWFLYIFIFAGFLIRLGHYPDSTLIIICSIFIFGLGIIVGLMGLFTLNNNNSYSEEIVRYEDGIFVASGIYSVVRHPMRIGLFIELLGVVILASAPLLVLPLIAIFTLQYTRTKDEELMLKEFFGEGVARYASAVPKFNFLYGLYRVFKNYQVRLTEEEARETEESGLRI